MMLCSCSNSVEPLEIGIPWQNGEITLMEVSREGELLFYDESRIEIEEHHLLFSTEYKFTGAPLIRRIHMDPETLCPRRNETIITDGAGKKSSLEVLYGEKRIRVKKNRGQGNDITTVDLPAPPFFDNEQFTLLVRALPLERGWKSRIRLFVPATAQTAIINLEVIRQEEVAVPAGTYNCYVVELEDLGQWVWVGVDPPHPLVKHVNESAGTLSELAEYYPGGSEEESDPGR